MLWSKLKHLPSLREDLTYYKRVRDVPGHPDFSIGFLTSIVEGRLRRDRRDRNREQISQSLRSRGMALPVIDAEGHDRNDDDMDSSQPTLPASTAGKARTGVCFSMVKTNKCAKGSACPWSHADQEGTGETSKPLT
eukprot:2698483-Amphidinium_carterae.6